MAEQPQSNGGSLALTGSKLPTDDGREGQVDTRAKLEFSIKRSHTTSAAVPVVHDERGLLIWPGSEQTDRPGGCCAQHGPS